MHTNPMRRLPIRMLACGAAALLVLTACGDDKKANDAVVPPVGPAVTAAATPSATPSASATPSESASASTSASASASPSETSGANSAAAGTVIEINLIGGKPEPKLDLNQEFKKGDTITIQVTTDKAYEIHIHGYDYKLNAEPGDTVAKTFVLDKAAGTYAVEVEDTGKLLFNLVVR